MPIHKPDPYKVQASHLLSFHPHPLSHQEAITPSGRAASLNIYGLQARTFVLRPGKLEKVSNHCVGVQGNEGHAAL